MYSGREGWRQLLGEQGFEGAVVAGEAAEARWLLSRQSVVLAVSNGSILAEPRPTVSVSLPSLLPPLPQQLLDGFRSLDLRNSLPQGNSHLSNSAADWNSCKLLLMLPMKASAPQ
jgi:hypothetical protein